MSLDIEINSKQYSLVSDRDGSKISTRPVQQFVQPIRDTGRTRPEDVAAYESFVVPNLAYGFGRARINSDVAFDPKEYRRFSDSTCDTRWMDRIYLPILAEDATQTNIDVVRAAADFKGESHLLGEDLVSAGVSHVVTRQYTGSSDTWEPSSSAEPKHSYGTVNPILTGNTALSNAVGTTAITTYGTDRALVVVLNGSDASSGNISDPSTITYAAATLTKVTSNAGTGDQYVGIYVKVAPALGTNNLVIAWTDAGGGGVARPYGSATTFQGVDQSTPISSEAIATGTATSASTAVTTVAGDVVVSAVNMEDTTITVPSDHTELFLANDADTFSHAITYEVATTTTTTMDYTFGASDTFKHLTAIINPSLTTVALDIIQHKTNLVALVANQDDQEAWTSEDGLTWNVATTQITAGLLDDTAVSANEDIDAGLLASIGGELIALVWDEDGGTITAFNSTNAGVAWTDESGFDIASTNGPQGVAVYPDIDGANKLYVGTAEGLYIVDTSPSTWTYELVMPMPHSTDNCRRMTIHQGSLFFAQGVDNSSPAPIYKLTVQGNSRIIEPGFGLSYGDGVPSDLLGPVRWMQSSSDQLFIAVGGGTVGGSTGKKGRILAWNGFGWHHMTKNSTADYPMQWLHVGSGDDGTPRLHFALRTASTTSDTKFLEQPLVNPRSGVTIKREGDGQFIELPYYDLGMPHNSKNFLAAHISADDLTASHETVEFHYGINGSDRDDTDLGDFTSAVSKLQFASGAGVSAKDIGIMLKLNREDGDTSKTPKIKDIIIEGVVVPSILYEHQMTIDLQQTAEDTGQSVETVISNIETLVESVIQTQVKFGQVSKYVTLDRERSAFSFQLNSWDASGAPNSMADRTGTFNLVLVEKVAS